ncbi:hypothetical protein BKA56DRAFT_541249 [Ilyonectria sp. MPI-CAGE-AT-0026]|nr:hypothetical protein BKA56DRAFT_541249 [Ilyonectria sp. MPI-CAGE-AT-0026]
MDLYERPLLGRDTHRYQGALQNPGPGSASIESLPGSTLYSRSVAEGHHPETETTRDVDSSIPTDLESEHNAPQDSTYPSLLKSTATSTGENISEKQSQSSPWHPFWLRQVVLGSFCGLFMCCTIALPVMLSFSKRNSGLLESGPNYAYVWRFSPTAIITIIEIIWARVEFQTLRYMPWMAIKSGKPLGPAGYSLDYTQMLSPMILIQSFRRKHFFVFLVATASIILKVQVVLSPSLYQIQSTQSSHPVEVEVLDSFAVTEDFSNVTGTAPYYNARALDNFDMMFPFGVTKEGAYQTFRLVNQGTTTRGATDAPLTVTVDGVFTDMKCLELESHSVSRLARVGSTYHNFAIDLKFENCEQSVTIRNNIEWVSPNEDTIQTSWAVDAQLEPTYPCSSLPRQNTTFLYFAGYYTPSAQNVSLPQLKTCAAVICSPTAYTSKVKIVDDGISPKVTLLSNQQKMTIDSNPWVMLQNSVPDILGRIGVSTANIVKGPVATAFGFRGKTPNATDISLYQNEVLTQAIMNLTEQIGPMVSHYQLRQSDKHQISGSIIVETYRLNVNEFVCLWMTGLFAVTMCIALWAIFQSRKVSHIWHRDPATILGTMIFFQSKTSLSTDIVKCVSGERESRKAEWEHSTHSPLVLRAWARAIFTIFVLGLIDGLVVTLNISKKSDGLVTIGEEGFMLLLWKSLPTLAMLLVSLYISLTDVTMRDLATLSNLSTRPCDSLELDMSLLDMLGFRALYHSLRLKAYAVTLSQILATVCAFLTTIAAVLLTTQIAPKSTSTQFPQESWFGSRQPPAISAYINEYSATREDLGSLLLARKLSNFTYPRNTYADLVFPTLGINDTNWNANTSAQVRTPAAKLLPSCVQLSEDDAKVSVHSSQFTEKFYADITQKFTCPNGSAAYLVNFLDLRAAIEKPGLSFTGEIVPSPGNLFAIAGASACDLDLDDNILITTPWRVQTYVWGKFVASKMKFDHLSIWRCNYSWAEVTTDVRLIWSNNTILLDHQNPPTQDNSTVRPWSPAFGFPQLGGGGDGLGVSDVFPDVELTDPRASSFSTQFISIAEPFGPIPVEGFGKPDQDDEILEALHSNLGFVSAQLANLEYRLGLDEKSIAVPAHHGDLPRINATIIDSGRRRLVQNPTVTFILIGILSLVVAVNIWALGLIGLRRILSDRGSWLLDMDLKGLAPKGFSSIAMMESLIHGSNFLKDTPEDVCQMSLNDLHQWLAGTIFRTGWFQRDGTREEEFTIGALEDESFPFLGDKEGIKKTRESIEGTELRTVTGNFI